MPIYLHLREKQNEPLTIKQADENTSSIMNAVNNVEEALQKMESKIQNHGRDKSAMIAFNPKDVWSKNVQYEQGDIVYLQFEGSVASYLCIKRHISERFDVERENWKCIIEIPIQQTHLLPENPKAEGVTMYDSVKELYDYGSNTKSVELVLVKIEGNYRLVYFNDDSWIDVATGKNIRSMAS